MKMSRRDRKMYNLGREAGKAEGYLDGYMQGINDGNPFNVFGEACMRMAENLKQIMTDPAILDDLAKAKGLQQEEAHEERRSDKCFVEH